MSSLNAAAAVRLPVPAIQPPPDDHEDSWSVEFQNLEALLLAEAPGTLTWAKIQKKVADMLQAKAAMTSGVESKSLTNKAIERFDESFQAFRRLGNAAAVAETRGNLGLAMRAKGRSLPAPEGLTLLDDAIALHRDTAAYFDREEGTLNWAIAQINLGGSLLTRAMQGETCEKERLLEEAIATHENALTFYAEERWPAEWANTYHNLGCMRSQLASERRSERDMASAIQEFQNALRYRCIDLAPLDWADTEKEIVRSKILFFRYAPQSQRGDDTLLGLVSDLEDVRAVYQKLAPHKCAQVLSFIEALRDMQESSATS